KSIEYNPHFFASLTMPELKAVIAHEVCHLAFYHHLRMGNRDIEMWNVACDFAVNLILKKSGFVIGSGWLYDEKFDGMSAEEIYSKIQDGKNKTSQSPVYGENPESCDSNGGNGSNGRN